MASLPDSPPQLTKHEQSMTSALGISGRERVGDQQINRQASMNSSAQQMQPFTNEIYELSSILISKSLVSIFCFLNPNDLTTYLNSVKNRIVGTRFSSRAIENQYCKDKTLSVQQKSIITQILTSPILSPFYFYCLALKKSGWYESAHKNLVE